MSGIYDPILYSSMQHAANTGGLYNSSSYFNAGFGASSGLGMLNPMSMGCGILGMGTGMGTSVTDMVAWNKQMNDANHNLSIDNMQYNFDLAKKQGIAQKDYTIATEELNAPQKNVNRQALRIQSLLKDGKYSQAMEVIQKDFTEAVKAKLIDAKCIVPADGEDFRTKLLDEYKNATGTSLITDAQGQGGKFLTGAKQGAFFGLGSRFMEDPKDLLNYAQGGRDTKADDAKLWAGRITSGVITGIAALFAGILAIKGAKEGSIALWRGLKWAGRSI